MSIYNNKKFRKINKSMKNEHENENDINNNNV